MMFSIKSKTLRWIDKSKDAPGDLCLHGDVVATIDDEQFEYNCTVSATALIGRLHIFVVV